MKFCKDCRYYDVSEEMAKADPERYARCNYESGSASPVTGAPAKQKHIYCDTLRNPAFARDTDLCGPDARFFQARGAVAVNSAIDEVAELRRRAERAEFAAALNGETIVNMQTAAGNVSDSSTTRR